MPRRTIYRAKEAVAKPHEVTAKRLVAALELLQKHEYTQWRTWTTKKLAKVARVSVDVAASMQLGRHTFTSDERNGILMHICKELK